MLDSSQFVIEPATIHDLDAIHDIECIAQFSPWTESMLKDSLSGNHLCWKLSIDNQINAYIIVMKTLDELELLNIVVAPSSQGLGLGTVLVEHLILFSKKNQFKNIFLEARASNATAIHLYLKSGFKQVGLRKNYYPGDQGREDALVMQLAH